MSTVQLIVPSGPAFGSFFENRALSTGVACWSRSLKTPSWSQRQLDDVREGRNDAALPLPVASRRHRNREALLVARLGERVELHLEPGAILAAHVHRQRLRDRAEAARLLGAVDPDLEGHRRRADLADENRERFRALRDLDHVGPGDVAFGEVRPARPLEARDGGLRRRAEAHAAVRIVLQVLR